jgi:coenzyme F420-dependent glucose-6-phosphate dehydrogenase
MADTKLGYWAAHEQYSMENLLKFVAEAERQGFRSTMTSDHFHPWWNDNAFGNFTWVWISAAAKETKNMQFVTGVTAPIYRYHPAIIAQAFASLDVLFPGRIGLGLGTGEAMNEVPLGFKWPAAKVRLARMKEAAEIIHRLWNNKEGGSGFVTYNGAHYHLRDARLYTSPKSHIPLYMAAAGKESVKVAAENSHGLITFLKPNEAKEVFDDFDKAAKDAGKDPSSLEKIAEYKVSFHEDYDKAFESATFWRATLIEDVFNSDISDPRKLQEKAEKEVPDEKLKESIQIVTSIDDCIKTIEEYFGAGFTKVYVHSTSPDEIQFLQAFGNRVLPHFSKSIGNVEAA